jgi:tetratricopeptide (TPR) repeat protein
MKRPQISNLIQLSVFLFFALFAISCGGGEEEKEEVPDRAKVAEAQKALDEENYEKAKSSIEYFLAQFPKDIEALFIYAEVLLKTGQAPKAKEKANLLLEIDPTLAEPYAILGEVAYSRREFPEALKLSRKALKINPKLQAPYWVIGEIYLLQGKVKAGIQVLLEAHNLAPKDVETLKKLASGYIKTKDYASAKKFLEIGLLLDENVPGLHYNLAVVYTNMGNGPKAMEHIELALEQYEDLDTLFWAGKSRDTRRLIERKFKLNK